MAYTRTTWANGNAVTPTLLNNIEDGIVENRLGVPAKQFGVVGNASFDNTTAIQAAIDYGNALTVAGIAYGVDILFPPGVYKVGQVQLKSRVRLVGSFATGPGIEDGPVRFTCGTIPDDGFMIGGTGTVRNAGVVGITALGNGASSKSGFINIPDARDCIFASLYAIDWGIEALVLGASSSNNRILFSFFAGLENTGYIAAQRGSVTLAGVDHQVGFCEFTGPQFASVTSVNLYCAAAKLDCYSSNFTAVVFQTGDVGAALTSGFRNRFVGCRFDRNAGHGLYLSGAGGSYTFTGCHFDRNSCAGNNTYDHVNVPSGGAAPAWFTGCMFTNNGNTVRYWINDQKNNAAFHNVYHSPVGDAAATANWSLSGGADPSIITGVDPYTNELTASPVAVGLRARATLQRSGALAETFPRAGATLTNLAALTSGEMYFVAIVLAKGQVISQIVFQSATTALAGGSNQWFGLWSSASVMLRLTADDTTTAWAANTEKTLTLSSSYTVPSDGIYYLSCMVNATTVPTLLGVGGSGTPFIAAPKLTARDTTNTGRTNPASAPGTAAATTGTGSYVWAYVK